MKEETILVYTDAPAAYDYPALTEEIDANAGITYRGKSVRLVRIEKNRSLCQINRYYSGMHFAYGVGSEDVHYAMQANSLTLNEPHMQYELTQLFSPCREESEGE